MPITGEVCRSRVAAAGWPYALHVASYLQWPLLVFASYRAVCALFVPRTCGTYTRAVAWLAGESVTDCAKHSKTQQNTAAAAASVSQQQDTNSTAA